MDRVLVDVNNNSVVKMDTRKVISEQLGYPTFVTDGFIGELYEPQIRCIVLEKAGLTTLIEETRATLKYWNSSRDLKRLIVISGANLDISSSQFSEDMLSNLSEREFALRNKVNQIVSSIHCFNKEVNLCGGKVLLTSLIPQPCEVHPGVSKNSLPMQEFISRLFVMMNDEIWKFNKENNLTTINYKDTLEVKPTKRKGKLRVNRVLYPGRQQKMIKTDCFEDNGSDINNELKVALKSLTRDQILKNYEKPKC